jgi:zinc transport system substrate-binding protein
MVRLFLSVLALGSFAVFPFFSTPWASEKVPVFVSIAPQKFFVEQIGRHLVHVEVMVEPGASPHTYEPKPGQMAAISKARVYFAIGVGFEKAWLKRISASNPRMPVVHTDHGIEKLPMASHHHHGDEKHHEKEDHHHGHDHGTPDPHIWLSPPLVMVQSSNIVKALQEVDPANRSVYEANHQAFVTRVRALDEELRLVLSGKKGMEFMVFHPAWGYFAKAYGLRQVPIEVEGKEPKPAQLKTLIDHAREHNIKVVFVQPQFSSKSAEQVAREIGGQVAFVDPLSPNWEENLREAAAKFKAAMK